MEEKIHRPPVADDLCSNLFSFTIYSYMNLGSNRAILTLKKYHLMIVCFLKGDKYIDFFLYILVSDIFAMTTLAFKE